MAKFLSILTILILGSGCCANPVASTIDIPPRPVLIPVSQDVWSRVPLEAQDAWSVNDLALKEYAAKLESRIRIHNETVQ